MEDIGPDLANNLVEPTPQIADDRKLAGYRQPGRESGRLRRAEKLPIADPFVCRHRLGFRHEGVMFTARHEHRGPADCPLLINDAKSTINIAALQRQRMIEDVKYPHFTKTGSAT